MQNDWKKDNVSWDGQCWTNRYATQGFPTSVENLRKDNYIGKIVYYFEIDLVGQRKYER
jgi:hypothetical protein